MFPAAIGWRAQPGRIGLSRAADGGAGRRCRGGVSWIVGKQSYAGTGLREGRVVTVNWGDTYPVVYVVMPGGKMFGTWADGKALERAVK